MNCKKFSCELSALAKFCPQCGEEITVEKHCPNCGELLKEGVKFCGTCGYSIVKEEPINVEESATIEELLPVVIEQTIEKEIKSNDVEITNWTLETFKSELNKLGCKDAKSKSAVVFFGTGVFYKHLYPLLTNDEMLIAIRHIQSKWLFARYQKEFVVLTNKRIIRFEKMQYFKPKVASLYYEEIQEIKSDEPSNAVTGTFIGEKVVISSWDDRQIVMRMVGKGAGQELGELVIKEKKNHKNTSQKTSTLSKNQIHPDKKMKGNKKKIIVAVCILLVALIAFISNDISSSTTELVQRVKNGYLGDYYDATIEEVFAEIIPGGSWDEMVTDTQDFSIVQYAIGTDTVIQFEIAANEQEFVVSHMKYKSQVMSQSSDAKMKLDEIYEEYYKNHLELGKQANTSFDNITTNGRFIAIPDSEIESQSETEQASIGLFQNSFVCADSDKRYLNNDEIEQMSDYEKLFVMYEILARHGAIFTNVEDGENIQLYFNSQDWYTPVIPVEEIYEEDLNTYEVENTKRISNTILVATDESEENYILPYSNSIYYTEADLMGLSQDELRLARNEIYAKHGRKFETEDLNQHFSSQPWYYGYLSAEEFDDSVLNIYEKANLDMIKNVESGFQPIEGQLSMVINIEDVWDTEYWSDGVPVTMQLGQTENGYFLQFIRRDRDNEVIWSGAPQSYKNNEYGGLVINAVGEDFFEGISNAAITVEWNSPEEIDHPSVYASDNDVITGTYSY